MVYCCRKENNNDWTCYWRHRRLDVRSYQLEGHKWLSRLASCGFGACLADDMDLGKTAEFDFLDELAIVTDGKDKARGDVSAMPGDKFVVKETASQLAIVVACSAEGEGVLLAVPRRDFELGYVRVLP